MASNVVGVVIQGDDQTAAALDSATLRIQQLEAKAQELAVQMEATDASFSMPEAKGTLALMSEQIGVTIPRHLRGFIAELPGVGTALEAAFSATAGLVLIDVVVKIVEKVNDFIEAHNSLAIAEKASAAAIDESDKSIIEQATELDKLEKAYELIGLKGGALLLEKMEQLNPEITAEQQAINYLTQSILELEQAQESAAATALEQAANPMSEGMVVQAADDPRIAAQQAALAAHQVALQAAQQKMLNLQKEYDAASAQEAKSAAQKALSDQQAAGEAFLAASKKIEDSRLDLVIADANLAAAEAKTSALNAVQAVADANEQKYQNDLDYLNKKLLLLQQDPDKNVNTLKELNAQIEALQTDHLAKQQQAQADFLNWLTDASQKAATAQIEAVLALGNALPDAAKPMQDLLNAYDQLGIKGTESFQLQLDAAQDAFAKMASSGLASTTDILEGEIAVQQAWVNLQQSLGQVTAEDQADLKNLQAQLGLYTQDLTKQTSQTADLGKQTVHQLDSAFGTLFTDLASGSKSASAAFENFGLSILKMLDEMVAKMLITWAAEKLIGLFSGAINDLGNSDINIAPTGTAGLLGVPPHAAGGTMGAGEIGLVGEMGPELFIPDTAGTVLPNSYISNGGLNGGNTYYMDFRGAQRGVSQEVKQALALTEARAVSRAMVGFYEWNRRRP